jgi:hypothetical protein
VERKWKKSKQSVNNEDLSKNNKETTKNNVKIKQLVTQKRSKKDDLRIISRRQIFDTTSTSTDCA